MGDEAPATRRAAGVIIFRGRRDAPEVLVLRNAREGHPGFAKGHLDEGEDELEGALREVREETGLVPRLDPAFRETIRYAVTGKKRGSYEKEVVYFLGEVEGGTPVALSKEHDLAEWLPVPVALARIPHASLGTALARAARFLGSRAHSTGSR